MAFAALFQQPNSARDFRSPAPDAFASLFTPNVQIPVGNAGPQRRAPEASGQRRTSTASPRSQWATPDLNCELQIAVGTAG
eukprot:s5391_g1.t1